MMQFRDDSRKDIIRIYVIIEDHEISLSGVCGECQGKLDDSPR